MTKKEKVYLFDHSPHLRSEWDYEKNAGVDPETLLPFSNKKYFWICPEHSHSFSSVIYSRTKGTGCPYCSGNLPIVGVNDFGTLFPELSDELVDPTRKSSDLKKSSNVSVLWRCFIGHEYSARPADRVKGDGCPYCAGHRPIVGETDLATTCPEMSGELFDPNHTPTSLMQNSSYRVRWKCDRGHLYHCTVLNRSSGRGCPYCSNQKVLVGFNDLATTHPELLPEWFDGSDPSKLIAGSHKKVKWKCSGGHIWMASLKSRAYNSSECPLCLSGSQTSKIEDRINLLVSGFLSPFAVSLPRHTSGRPMSVDGCYSFQGHNVILEYDGSYFHFDRVDIDTSKSEILLDSGFLLVRIREQSRFELPHLDIQHPNLLQLSVPYSKTDEHLIEAVEKIKTWLDSKQQDSDNNGKE